MNTWNALIDAAISRGCTNAGEFILGLALAHHRPTAADTAEIMRLYGQHRHEEMIDEPADEPVILPYPPSANRYWRHAKGRTYVSAEAKTYRESVGWTCRSLGLEPMDGNVAVTIDVYRPRKVGDIDNFAKVALDALQGHMFKNDKQIVELHMRRHDDKTNPRVVVSVRRAS